MFQSASNSSAMGQLQEGNNVNVLENLMAMTEHRNSRRASGSTSSIHSSGPGHDQNMDTGAGVAGYRGGIKDGWQTFMKTGNENNSSHNNNPSSSASSNFNASSNSFSALYQGHSYPNPSDGSSPDSGTDPASGPPMMQMMNNSNLPFHPGVGANPNTLTNYMSMGNMNLNMGLNTMGYGLQGFSANGMVNPSTMDANASAILSSQLNPQALLTGFSGAADGMTSMMGAMMQRNGSGGLGGGGGMNNIAAMRMGGGMGIGVMSGQSHDQVLGLVPHQRPHKLIKARRKKPKDHPSRPLSAYNLFFKDERKRILDQKQKEKKEYDAIKKEGGDVDTDGNNASSSNTKKRQPHGKIGFENLAKTIGARWRKISPEKLKHCQALAKEDHERYANEMKEYEKKLKNLKAKEEAARLEQKEEKVQEAKTPEQVPVQEKQEDDGKVAGQACLKVNSQSSQNHEEEREVLRKRSREGTDTEHGISEDGESSMISKKLKDENDNDNASTSTIQSHLASTSTTSLSSAGANQHPNDDLRKDPLMGTNNPTSLSNALSSILMTGGAPADLLMRHGKESISKEKEILQLLQMQQNLLGGFSNVRGGNIPSISSMLATQGIQQFASSPLTGGGRDTQTKLDLLRQMQMTRGGVNHSSGDDTSDH